MAPPRRVAAAAAGLRFWRPLNVGGDIGWFRANSGRWDLYRRLLPPDFQRWAFYAIWDDESSLDAFLARSELGRAWARAAEACHFWLRPNHVRGPWQGTQILRGSETPRSTRAAVAYLTRADLSSRGALAFWSSAAPGLSHHLPEHDEMPFALALADRPYMQMLVFSVWRTREHAVKFAYREQGHRDAVERVRRAQPDVLERFSAASFEPYRCDGTWEGSYPVGHGATAAPHAKESRPSAASA